MYLDSETIGHVELKERREREKGTVRKWLIAVREVISGN